MLQDIGCVSGPDDQSGKRATTCEVYVEFYSNARYLNIRNILRGKLVSSSGATISSLDETVTKSLFENSLW
jgi:hypothetical protein